MTIREILKRKQETYIMYKYIKMVGQNICFLDELTDKEYDLEFEWFEVTTYWGKRCIEFNL